MAFPWSGRGWKSSFLFDLVLYKNSWEGLSLVVEEDCEVFDGAAAAAAEEDDMHSDCFKGRCDDGGTRRWCWWVGEDVVQEKEDCRECQLLLHNVRELKDLKTLNVG